MRKKFFPVRENWIRQAREVVVESSSLERLFPDIAILGNLLWMTLL